MWEAQASTVNNDNKSLGSGRLSQPQPDKHHQPRYQPANTLPAHHSQLPQPQPEPQGYHHHHQPWRYLPTPLLRTRSFNPDHRTPPGSSHLHTSWATIIMTHSSSTVHTQHICYRYSASLSPASRDVACVGLLLLAAYANLRQVTPLLLQLADRCPSTVLMVAWLSCLGPVLAGIGIARARLFRGGISSP